MANTWGYGAMTNHFGDVCRNSKMMIIFGANTAVANPIGFKHLLRAKDRNNAKLVVVDPVYTKTAVHADEYVRVRPGTDIALVYGMLHLIFKNGWEDKEFIKTRSYGVDEIREEAKKWTPEEVENVTGVPAVQLEKITHMLATIKPATLFWALGITQHSVGSSNTRVLAILQLVLGNVGKEGAGTNIIRGHDNVQGATDMGCLADTLPAYYGLGDDAWEHFCNVWGVDMEYMKSRFAPPSDDKNWMNEKGFSLARWWQGVKGVVPYGNDKVISNSNVRVLWVQGTGITSMAHTVKIQEALKKLDMIVIAEPFVNEVAVLADRPDGIYIIPASTQFETEGYVTATNRAMQWRSQVVKPIYESKEDQEIMFAFAKKFGFYDEYTRGMKMQVLNHELKQIKADDEKFVWPDDATTEMSNGLLSIGLRGISADRLRKHQQNWEHFDPDTQEGKGGEVKGEYYGLPWPCWDEKHPGTAILWNKDIPYVRGGMGFRNRFGLERNGVSQLADDSISLKDCKVKGGYPQITKENIEKVFNIKLSDEEKAKMGSSWSTDISGIILEKCRQMGACCLGNARARAIVWEFADPIPKHREPIHSPRWDLVQKYPTWDDQEKPNFRVTTAFKSEQQRKDWSKEFPIIVSSMRLVNLSGAGMLERTSKYLAAITPEMFANVHPELALEYGINDGDMMWIHSPQGTKIKVKCVHNHSVTPDRICMPYNFAGILQGVDLSHNYPEGTKPYTIGESSNTVTNYGFDINTQISEFNAGLCKIEKA